jgi:hypothetical protein
MCATCGHAHTATEQAVRTKVWVEEWQDGHDLGGYLVTDQVEDTMMICGAPGCRCYELDPTDAEDRVVLIKSGEIDA